MPSAKVFPVGGRFRKTYACTLSHNAIRDSVVKRAPFPMLRYIRDEIGVSEML
jgi:hypothetical protein